MCSNELTVEIIQVTVRGIKYCNRELQCITPNDPDVNQVMQIDSNEEVNSTLTMGMSLI